MSHTSQNITKEDLIASNVELKAHVEYLAKQVAQLTKLKMSMVQTPKESEDEQEEDAQSEVPSATMRRNNQEKSSSNFKVEIPTFDGKDDPEDFIEWLEMIERVFDYTEVPEDKKVKLVALKFRGYASTWWTNTTTERKREGKAVVKTWAKMRALLKKKFIPTHYIRENIARLQHLRQGNQSVEEYNREFEELLMRCDLQENDSQTFVRYLFGLNTHIAHTVELQTFESLEELTKLALKVEAQLKKCKSSLSHANSSYPSTSTSTPLAAKNPTPPSPQNPKTVHPISSPSAPPRSKPSSSSSRIQKEIMKEHKKEGSPTLSSQRRIFGFSVPKERDRV
ncbi:unnamed protein product [Cuscuta campestris]|uniref:Retrotransposon gag domain-containing protein n=1 Tax=Cuscuta campestris TaxID=132261 RepID=A0A484MD99_9ASTE|nr:unnamed protein product [Cuscuta campestris]